MLQPALDLLPDDTRVGFLGMARDERTARAALLSGEPPRDLGDDEVVVLDVMIATGGSGRGRARRSCATPGRPASTCCGLIAAPEGLARLAAADPDVPITVAAIDQRLDERHFIVPGLGDAGDRLYSESG